MKNKLNTGTLPFEVTNNQLIKYKGNDTYINIPEGIKVIGKEFSENSTFRYINVKKLYIPQSVEEIERNALKCLVNLEEIVVDSQNKNYKSDGNCLIDKHKNELIRACNNSVIPDYIEIIGEYAFGGCCDMTEITIPKSVKVIKSFAFCNCERLKEIKSFGNVELLERFAFSDCTDIKHIQFPKSLREIKEYCFADCTDLLTVSIPKTVELIEDYAFFGCNKIEVSCEKYFKPYKWERSWNVIDVIEKENNKIIPAEIKWGVILSEEENKSRQKVIDYLDSLETKIDERMSLNQVEQFVDRMIEDEASFDSALEFANENRNLDQLDAYCILYQILCDK